MLQVLGGTEDKYGVDRFLNYCGSKYHSPRNFIAPPERKIANPAKACEYRSSLCKGNLDKPYDDARTIASMVAIVVSPKTDATRATLSMLFLAAGYMIKGIRGSQGPKTNIVNKTHGVIPIDFESWR